MSNEVSHQYLMSEAEYMRKIFEDSAKWIEVLERYSLLVTGAIWSWVAANISNTEFQIKYIIWLPVLVQFLFGVRAWSISKDMASMIDYLKKIETKIQLPDNLGWATYWDTNRSRYRDVTGYLFWGVLQCISLIVALLITL